MRRYSDPDIFKETVKQKNAIKQGDILPSECNVDDFERYSLNALVFVQSLSGACETLVKQLSEYNDEYNVMRMKVIVVTNDDPQQFITNNQIKTTILQDVNQSIAKNFGLDSANNQNVFLILPSFQVAKVIASISTANFGPVLKKEAVEFINLCDVAEENELDAELYPVVTFYPNNAEILWRQTAGNLHLATPGDANNGASPNTNRTFDNVALAIANGGNAPCGTRIHDGAHELGPTSYVFRFKTTTHVTLTLQRVRDTNGLRWTQQHGRQNCVARYHVFEKVSTNIDPTGHLSTVHNFT